MSNEPAAQKASAETAEKAKTKAKPAASTKAPAAAKTPGQPAANASAANAESAAKSNSASLASETLKGFFSEIERLEEEKAQIGADISEIYKAAKNQGFDTDAMRAVLKRMKMTKEEREEREAQIDLYEGVLGLTGEKTEAEDMGIEAASQGQPLTSNPYTKKDPRNIKWANAWNMQTALMAATGDKTEAKRAAPDQASDTKAA